MRLSQWFRPPRLVLTLFLGVTGTLWFAMAILAWQFLDQDGRLADQRVQQRLESAADAAAGAMLRDVLALEDKLAALADRPGDHLASALQGRGLFLADDGVVVASTSNGMVSTGGIMLYIPQAQALPHDSMEDDAAFARGEALEFEARNLGKALAVYEALAHDRRSTTRGGALMRMARVQAKLGRTDAALASYDALAKIHDSVNGIYAELAASYGRCLVLRDANRQPALAQAAAQLLQLLYAGMVPVGESQFRHFEREAMQWVPKEDGTRMAEAVRTRLAVSAAVSLAWSEWHSAGRTDTGGTIRRMVWFDGTPVLMWARAVHGRFVAVVVGSHAMKLLVWTTALQAAARSRASLQLTDANGRLVIGEEGSSAIRVRRTASDSGLPWTIIVTDANPEVSRAETSRRRALVLAGLGALGLFVAIGSAFILRTSRREVEVARLQTEFVAAVSHEFRTPLASMRQLSELLVDGRVPNDEKRAGYYRTLQRESERLHRLVEALLDFGRMESRKREYAMAPIDVNALVEDVVGEFRESAAARQMECALEVRCDADAGSVLADREALGRAMWNLLDNAVKYSAGAPVVSVETARADGRVAVRVRDRGVGIAPDEQRVIFDKFKRGASAAATRAKGTGLGLAMVKHIVDAHGGRVSVESELGAGSTFTIELFQTGGGR